MRLTTRPVATKFTPIEPDRTSHPMTVGITRSSCAPGAAAAFPLFQTTKVSISAMTFTSGVDQWPCRCASSSLSSAALRGDLGRIPAGPAVGAVEDVRVGLPVRRRGRIEERVEHGVTVVVSLHHDERGVVLVADRARSCGEHPDRELPVQRRDVLAGRALVDDDRSRVAANALRGVDRRDVALARLWLLPDAQLAGHLDGYRLARLAAELHRDVAVEECPTRDEEARLRIARVLLVDELLALLLGDLAPVPLQILARRAGAEHRVLAIALGLDDLARLDRQRVLRLLPPRVEVVLEAARALRRGLVLVVVHAGRAVRGRLDDDRAAELGAGDALEERVQRRLGVLVERRLREVEPGDGAASALLLGGGLARACLGRCGAMRRGPRAPTR